MIRLFAAMLLGTVLVELMNVPVEAQDTMKNGRKQVYSVDWWVTAPIIAVGAFGGFNYVANPKSNITQAELDAVNPNNVPFFDRSSLHQNIDLVGQYDGYSSIGQKVGALLPLVILADPDVRPDWLNVLAIGLEANAVELGLFTLSPIGPRFITRYRPLVYYPAHSGINRYDGNNKDGFYSGHVASVAVSSFFVGKVYADYHPDANRFLIYGLASIPPLAMGVIRFMTLDHFPSDIAAGFAIGTLIGILDPELHRTDDHTLSFGMYSSPTMGTGLTMQWKLLQSDTR